MPDDDGVLTLWRSVKADPTAAHDSARALLEDPGADPVSRAWALATCGRAAFELGNNTEALRYYAEAAAASHGDQHHRIQVSHAAALAAAGQTPVAIALLEEVAQVATPAAGALARSQRALLQIHAGEVEHALDVLSEAVPVLEQHPADRDAAARALSNAGYCELLLGRPERATGPLARAIDLGRQAGEATLVAGCLQNLGYAAMLLGDLPLALERLEEARAHYRAIGDPGRNLSTLLDDLAETYRIAGLTSDAVDAAAAAVATVTDGGNAEKLTDARFRLARCRLDHGDAAGAVEAAALAAEAFTAQQRPRWATRARLLALEAAASDDDVDPPDTGALRDDIDALERAGWHGEGVAARNRLIEASVDADTAHRFVHRDAQTPDDTSTPVVHRLEWLLHDAHRRRLDADDPSPPLDEAARTLRRHAERLADPELRAGAGRLAERFRRIALDLVLDGPALDGPALDGRRSRVGEVDDLAAAVIGADEAFRAVSLTLPRASAPSRPEVAELSRRVRDLSRRLTEAEHPDPARTAELRAVEHELRMASLRASVTDPWPRRSGGVGSSEPAQVTLSDIRERLGPRRLVELVVHRGDVVAVVVDGEGGADVRAVGQLAALADRAASLRADLARLLRPGLSASSQQRRWQALRAGGAGLGAELLAGVEPDGRGLVVAAPAALIGSPWSIIVGDRAETVTLSPSASVWLRPGAAELVDPMVGVIVGPGLEHAEAEVQRLVAHHGVDRLARADTVGEAQEVISASDVVHVVAHGTFRPDSPRFTSLRLADGPYSLGDLDAVAQAPTLVTFAACDIGRHVDVGGSELLGAVPGWIAVGVATVLAPVCAVGDQEMAEVTDVLHAHLDGGRTAAEALGATASSLVDSRPAVQATVASVLAVGADGPRVSRTPRGALSDRGPGSGDNH